ncbi:flavin monoamine oxidase family protein [Alkalicoccus saliphilus]|nr:NAD(P)/FAD-dependent oxidoreductase [Alkalicoccus saliphilus]
MAAYDAIIIGGGFSGLAAARELSANGCHPLVLEAKNRLGGRAWTDERLGKKLEMGGTWFHWYEPHIWSEITKYNLETTQHVKVETLQWHNGKSVKKVPLNLLYTFLEKRMKTLTDEASFYFPNPYRPLEQQEKLLEIDGLSTRDRLNRMKLTSSEYEWMDSLWSLIFHGRTEEASYTHSLRWLALSMNDWKRLLETFSAFQLTNGTKELISCIAADVKGDIHLSSEVTAVEKQKDETYAVTTQAGETFHGNTVIVTLPPPVIQNVAFSPPLSSVKRQAGKEKAVSRGVKVWVRIKSSPEPFIAAAPAHFPLNYIQYEYEDEDGSFLVCFGSDAGKLDVSNISDVEDAVHRILPDVEIMDCAGHDWTRDKFAGQTWSMHGKNQLTRYHMELNREENGIFLAGDSLADGGAGLMDGALESGIKTAGKVRNYIIQHLK